MIWRPLQVVILLAAAGTPAAADFSDALEAYDAGRFAEAAAELRTLAADGHLDAMTALAGFYSAGTGVRQDHRMAAALYRRAADCGHAVAQLNLGDMYGRGLGVERDLVAADVYLARAAAQGSAWARDRRAEIRATMSAAEREQAAARLAGDDPACLSAQRDDASDGS